MTEVKLDNLKLFQFKGIKELELGANGKNANVYGDNGTGKTSIFDSFSWLLYGKDSQNKVNFGIQTLVDGVPVRKQIHGAEAILKVNGEKVTLRKEYHEVYKKKRNEPERKFDGYTTDYFFDGVPVGEKVYQQKISEMIKESLVVPLTSKSEIKEADLLKTLTSPTFFSEQLAWKDRRNVLLKVCGDITDEDVISLVPELKNLPQILGRHTIDEYKKIVLQTRKTINAEKEMIPVQIRENQAMLPDIEEINIATLKEKLAQLESQIDQQKELKSSILSGKSILEKERDLQAIENELAELKRNHNSDIQEQIWKLEARYQEEKGNLAIMQSRLSSIEKQIENDTRNLANSKKSLAETTEKLEKMRADYRQVKNSEFHFEEGDCTCPTCSQELPAEQVEAAKIKAQENFNLEKSEKLADVKKIGDQLVYDEGFYKGSIEEWENTIKNSEKERNGVLDSITVKKNAIVKLEEQLSTLKNTVTDVSETQQYKEKNAQKLEIVNGIATLKEHANEAAANVQLEITKLQSEKQNISEEVSKFASVDVINRRIAELEAREDELNKQFNQTEKELHLLDLFVQEKVRLLEEKINSKFKMARFRLFKQQVNGGLEECCEATYDGVPYSEGLNNAARINVGLDIINTLSKHYGINAPVFIDNAESVTKLIDSDSQIISLIVSEKDKKLRVETQESNDYPTLNMEVI